MKPRKQKPRPEPLSPEQELAELAHRINFRRHPNLSPGFWTTAAESLLVRLLPLGLDNALTRVRAIGKDTEQHLGELGPMRDWDPKAISSVISTVDSTLESYINLDLSPFLTQPVKTQNPLKGRMSHGVVEKDVHEGVQAGCGAAA